MRGLAALSLAGILTTVLSGCQGTTSLNPNTWSHRSSSDEPLQFNVIGPVAVDLESFGGDVYITGNPKLQQGTVRITREGVHGPGRKKEAAASLDEIRYDAQLVPGELGPVLRVIASTSHAEPHFQRAHVHIELPDVEGITVKTRNGRVYATNLRGPVDITTSNGDVRVLSNQPITQSVTVVNNNGDIDYRIRGESTGVFDARTINGRVQCRTTHGNLRIQEGSGDQSLQAVLNQGQNSVTLRAANGDIRIAVVPNPEQVGMIIKF